MRIRFGNSIRLAGVATLAAVAGLLAPASARADFSSNIYTSGHADIGVGFEDDNLHLHYHFEGGVVNGEPQDDVELEPGEVTTVVPESERITLGSGQSLSFLGLGEGDEVSILPQTFKSGVPFLGLATEELSDADWTSDITFSLVGVAGPDGSQMAIWQDGTFGQTVLFDTLDGIGSDDAFSLGTGLHDHANYGFTHVGLYDVTIRVSGTHTSLGDLTDEATFRFQVDPFSSTVIPEPSSIAMMGLGAFGLLGAVAVRRSRSVREEKSA